MNFLLLLTLLTCCAVILVSALYMQKRSKISTRKKKTFLAKWMKMTKEQRKAFDDVDKIRTMERKQTLIKSIRKEYDQIRRINK